MAADERIEIASTFLLQSPPGEINDVLNDVRAIIEDDDALQTGLVPALQKYNLAQFTTVQVPGQNHSVIISEAGRLKVEQGEEASERFVDPRSKQSFAFDHLRLEATDPQPIDVDEANEAFRESLEMALTSYAADHFADGVASVFIVAPGQFALQLVANKYNPPNFWSGRWRSEYIVDFNDKSGESGEPIIKGSVQVTVHYYEQGNVQLATSHAPTIPLPVGAKNQSDLSGAAKIVALIQREESAHQAALSATFSDMAEKSFRSLRRALPLTKQKMDWERVSGYKLGAELAASRGIFSPTSDDG